MSITSKSKFARSLHRRDLRGNGFNNSAVGNNAAGGSQSATHPSRIRRLLARLAMWLPPKASLQALITAIRRLLLGGGWQHANKCAILLLRLRPLLFCSLYAAGQKWAAWALCIACDIAAVKLVRLVPTCSPLQIMNCRIYVSDCSCSAAHAHGMEDSNAKAAVQAAESKWQWYLLRNPFYNATVSLFCYPLPFAVH